MKSIQYFQHDYDARHDEKIIKLRRVMDAKGIGIYWCLVECLYCSGGKLPFSDLEEISYDLRFTIEDLEKVIKDFGLFQYNETYFWSNTILSRLKERANISDKRRAAALQRYNGNNAFNANAQQKQCKSNTNAHNGANILHGKDKNINIKEKDKNIKENNYIESKDSLSVVTDAEDKIDYVSIVAFYNNSVKGHNMPKCVKLTDKRKAAVRARVKEYGLEKVFEAITRCVNSSFCNGRNDRNWNADFDFIFKPDKMAKILEGRYDNEILNYGNNGNSNERNARAVGEKVLGDIFAEIEERERTQRTTD